MSSRSIKCPECATTIEIEALLSQQIESELVEQMQADNQKQIEREKTRAAEKVTEKFNLQLTDMQEQLQEQKNLAEKATKQELEVRKQVRALEEKEKTLDLELERRLSTEKQKIEKSLTEQYAETNDLKVQELKRKLEEQERGHKEALRKVQQGSMESQGEVLEDDLELRLQQSFPMDTLEEVKKGKAGADIIHTVKNETHQACGVIVWEAKNTKNWSPKWIEKLKDDQREAKANLAVLVSRVLPPEIDTFGQINGIWVSSIAAAIPLASALRQQLSMVEYARNASAGQGDKVELMYEYFSGDEFRQKVEGIVDAFTTMQTQLNKEKTAMQRIWNERDKQIQRVIANTTGMYGDVRGIIGTNVGEIAALELDNVLLEEEGE